jgi:hypothetical protein
MSKTQKTAAGHGARASDAAAERKPDAAEHDRREQAMVDLGSESSFPASDPPSYMGGTAVAGPPPRNDSHREPVSTELISGDKVDRSAGKPRK